MPVRNRYVSSHVSGDFIARLFLFRNIIGLVADRLKKRSSSDNLVRGRAITTVQVNGTNKTVTPMRIAFIQSVHVKRR